MPVIWRGDDHRIYIFAFQHAARISERVWRLIQFLGFVHGPGQSFGGHVAHGHDPDTGECREERDVLLALISAPDDGEADVATSPKDTQSG